MLLIDKKILISFFIIIPCLFFGSVLPKPQNNQMYTEYLSYKYTPYLKKPVVSSGIIAMDGKEKFIFKQIKPVAFKIKKVKGKITYKRESMDEIIIENNSSNNDFMFLFDESVDITKDYNVNEKKINDKTEFMILPKNKGKYKKIIIISNKDKFERLEFYFSDNSNLIYEFTNTVTGKPVDEKVFE
ncbi:MAG: outer-membrane lipoprotein carrier protein LolA [Spirochaetes bacterium]|nr:outer-membrane lipoprotein carrier protein LolA [Spirochaetota bacterium]